MEDVKPALLIREQNIMVPSVALKYVSLTKNLLLMERARNVQITRKGPLKMIKDV